MTKSSHTAYEFTIDQPIEQLRDSLASRTTYEWRLRESAWYGEYLVANPHQGVKVRVHEWPGSRYTMLIDQVLKRSETGEPLRSELVQLMEQVGGTNLAETDSYD